MTHAVFVIIWILNFELLLKNKFFNCNSQTLKMLISPFIAIQLHVPFSWFRYTTQTAQETNKDLTECKQDFKNSHNQ